MEGRARGWVVSGRKGRGRMYEHPDQAVPVGRKFWRKEGTLPEEESVEAG